MKVLCIDKSRFINYHKIAMVDHFIKEIKEGEIYIVIEEVEKEGTEKGFHGGYILEEFGDVVWEKEGFAPVSDQENLQLTEEEALMIRIRHRVYEKLIKTMP